MQAVFRLGNPGAPLGADRGTEAAAEESTSESVEGSCADGPSGWLLGAAGRLASQRGLLPGSTRMLYCCWVWEVAYRFTVENVFCAPAKA